MSDDFSADWLALREPYDARARSRALADAFLGGLADRPRLVDLGAGRGANARFLDRIAGNGVQWRLVDRDPALLAEAASLGGETICVDFAAAPEALDLAKSDGITASALFDLVSEAWFDRFVAAASGLPLLIALTVDGRFVWNPKDDADSKIMALFAADMRRDKGFGPAMGSAAPSRMMTRLQAAGYRVASAPSSWHLGPEDGNILRVLVDLVASIAGAVGADWHRKRLRQLSVGTLRLTVGHVDILARR